MTTKNMIPETPVDEQRVRSDKGKKSPKRGIRKRVLGQGEGDYCIYEISQPGSNMPQGSLIPLPNLPRFVDTVSAMKWLRNESGDLLAGKQVMVFRAMEILHIQVQQKAVVTFDSKPKVTVTDPTKETSDG